MDESREGFASPGDIRVRTGTEAFEQEDEKSSILREGY